MNHDHHYEPLELPYRILAVDDEPEALEVYHRALGSEDTSASDGISRLETNLFGSTQAPRLASEFSLTCRGSGREAVEEARRAFEAGRPYSAILLDKCMPSEEDGCAAAEQIREIDPAAVIVLITGDQSDELQGRFRPFASDDRFFLFYKPFYPIELKQFLSATCAKARLEHKLFLANRSLEEQVRQRTAKLALAKKQAEAALIVKSTFLANISHDLRTPLNGILGMAALLAGSKLDEGQTEQLTVIQKSGLWLLEIVENLIEASVLEAGPVEVRSEELDAGLMVELAADIVRCSADEKGMTIATAANGGCQLRVRTDRKLLQRILANLIGNAVKHSAGGRVTVEVRGEGKDVRFSVSDTGPGIATEALPKIFERFWRGETSRHVSQGSGLGLAISKELVELMGGEIGVHSEVGVGSEFWFRLPASRC